MGGRLHIEAQRAVPSVGEHFGHQSRRLALGRSDGHLDPRVREEGRARPSRGHAGKVGEQFVATTFEGGVDLRRNGHRVGDTDLGTQHPERRPCGAGRCQEVG